MLNNLTFNFSMLPSLLLYQFFSGKSTKYEVRKYELCET